MPATHNDAPGQDPGRSRTTDPADRQDVQAIIDKAVSQADDPRAGTMATGADVPGGGAWNPLDLDTPFSTDADPDLGDDVLEHEDEGEDD